MAAVCFQKPVVVISRPWIEIPGRNLIRIYLFAFLKARCHKTRKQKNIYDGISAIWNNLHNVITLSVIVQFRQNFFVLAELHEDDDKSSASKSDVEFPYGVRLFSKAEVVVPQL